MLRTARSVAIVAAIVALACSGEPPMTTAEYTEWCFGWTNDIQAAEPTADDDPRATVGDTLEILEEWWIPPLDRVADRVPEETRGGHERLREYGAALVDLLDDYDLDLTEDDLSDSADYHAAVAAIEQEYLPDAQEHLDKWC